MRGKAICVGAPLKKQTHLLNIFSGKIQSPYNGCNMRAIQGLHFQQGLRKMLELSFLNKVNRSCFKFFCS